MKQKRPKQFTIERDGEDFIVGDGGDFSWDEIDALQLQIDRWNMFHDGKQVKKISAEILNAIVRIKKVFPGAVIEDWRKLK